MFGKLLGSIIGTAGRIVSLPVRAVESLVDVEQPVADEIRDKGDAIGEILEDLLD